jgi:hypothetical protein
METGHSSFYFQASYFDTSIVTVKQYYLLDNLNPVIPNQTGFLTLTYIAHLYIIDFFNILL